MNRILLLFCAAVFGGCATGNHSRYDEFEKVKVDQMVGNNVQGSVTVFEKTIVCLNAMRETRWPGPITNQSVTYATNYVVSSVTNLTVNTSANQQVASATNAVALPPTALVPAAVAGETNQTAANLNAPNNSTASGETISTTSNRSEAASPNQKVTSGTVQTVRMLNNQITVATNNLSITSGTNQIITSETNYVITTFTNQNLLPVTNVTVVSAEQPQADYYLFTEITPPPDFALLPGDSLVLLIDGNRHAFAPATPRSGWTTRRGFVTTFYKVPAEVLVGVANATEVKLRIKGSNVTIERELSRSCRQNIREFLLEHFGPDDPPLESATKHSGIAPSPIAQLPK
jgi:hypothetical protein